MHADARKLLWDARRACERVAAFTAGKSFDAYRADLMLRSAVERQFEIVGEALNRLDRIDPDCGREIPDLRGIVGLRNVLIHGYASVNDRMVWDIVETRLGPLLAALDAQLTQP
jgi:uncharacterized protein with HEPN domain